MKARIYLVPLLFLIVANSIFVLEGIFQNSTFERQSVSSQHIQQIAINTENYGLPQAYVEHSRIVIQNNFNFSLLGFSGDGSPEKPFIIESLNITHRSLPLISIQDTNAHFYIKNCILNGLNAMKYPSLADNGIFLKNVTHGTIKSNFIHNCGYGVMLENSKNNIVSHNHIFQNSEVGILTGFSLGNNTITNNTISNNRVGIFIASEYNTVKCNNISQNDYGISLYKGNNMIADNILTNNHQAGIYLDFPYDNSIIGNTMIANGLEIRFITQIIKLIDVFQLGQITVINNTVNGRPLVYWQNKMGGIVPLDAGQIVVVDSINIEITGQNPSQVSTGILAAHCSNLSIHHNDISNCTQYGIKLVKCKSNAITYNTISNNSAAITLKYSDNSSVAHNIISNCNKVGIDLTWNSNFNEIEHNLISTCERGITIFGAGSLLYSGQNLIFNNTIFQNCGYGIYLESDTGYNRVIQNNFLCNNQSGDSQAFDNGKHNDFESNYWNDNKNLSSIYLIDGHADNNDQSPLTQALSPIISIYCPPMNEIIGHIGFIGIFILFTVLSSVNWLRKRPF